MVKRISVSLKRRRNKRLSGNFGVVSFPAVMLLSNCEGVKMENGFGHVANFVCKLSD
jgi:hypothetical protein